MLPDYIFQAVYGVPEHELRIATTTRFFNNEDRGNRFPTYTRSQAQNNTVMLDSWLSVGAAFKDYVGVLKSKDDGDNTIINTDGVLQNNDPEAGIPIKEQDGAILGASEPVALVGFNDTDLTIFDDGNSAPMPTILSSRDGVWSSLNGSVGLDSMENIVLVGQFTTDGEFEFEMNIQIRNQLTLGVERYVARDPLTNEIQWYQLIYNDSTVSVKDEFVSLKEDQVSIYPNPTAGDVTVRIDQQIPLTSAANQFTLSALDGLHLFNGRITDHVTELDFNGIVPGTYILTLELENKYLYTGKVSILK
jgi:hypothetical protein